MIGSLAVSLFRSARDSRPRRQVLEGLAFGQMLSVFSVREDLEHAVAVDLDAAMEGRGDWAASLAKNGIDKTKARIWAHHKARLPAWSPATYPDGATRKAATVEAVGAVVLDVDEGTDLGALWHLWPDHARVLHTSWSSTRQAPKARLVVPLHAPVAAELWPRVWAWARKQARARGIEPDGKCSDASRIYFLPAIANDKRHRVAWVDLDAPALALDAASLPDPTAPRPRRAKLQAWRQARHGYRTDYRDRDPQYRRDAADTLGALVTDSSTGPRADKARCPDCGRKSVWWWISPYKQWRAHCDHEQSCGWTGHLSELLEH